MTDEEIIRELKSVEEQYRNKPVHTFEVNISSMARSCRQHIEQLAKDNEELKSQIEKMKNCQNCKNRYPETKEDYIFCAECSKLDETKDNIILTKWELSE